MFGNIFKKIIPLAATAGVAYMAGSGGVGSNLFTTSSLKEKLLNFGKKEALKREQNLFLAVMMILLHLMKPQV